MKQWIGRWLIGVAVLHTLFSALAFSKQFLAFAQRGMFNSVGVDLMANLAVWFTLFGVVLLICGLAISTIERASLPIPKSIGVSMLVLACIGAVLLPASGFWLVIPPAVAILLRKPVAAPLTSAYGI